MHRFFAAFVLLSASLPAYQEAPPVRIYRIQERQPVKRVEPAYPALARQRRISGIVTFTVRVGTDGTVLSAKLISGHPLLVRAAAEALRQWVYEPMPAEVITRARVTFELGDIEPQPVIF
jgi:protein TonB